MRYISYFFRDIPGLFVQYFQIITNFFYVCQSISWLTSLPKLGQYRNISCSGWDIFLKLYRDIPRIFLHYFQISSYFWLVCQSVSWLTSVQKLGQYRDISCSGWYIFLKLFGDIPGMFVLHFQVNSNSFMCISLFFGSFPYWNKTNIWISPVLQEISFWNFLETIQGYF